MIVCEYSGMREGSSLTNRPLDVVRVRTRQSLFRCTYQGAASSHTHVFYFTDEL